MMTPPGGLEYRPMCRAWQGGQSTLATPFLFHLSNKNELRGSELSPISPIQTGFGSSVVGTRWDPYLLGNGKVDSCD